MLCQIYHHALHDRFSAARDLFLMSGVQERIADMSSDARSQEDNVKLEILYNRALTMLGVAAFRSGLYTEAHECLSEICGSGHTKELLAQGISLFRTQHGQERDERAELEERRRLVPYHMHINVDLVDACHLTAAMLLEVPNIAAADFDPRRRELSRAFRKHLDAIDKKHFVGPPETTRDHIMMAALALADGELDRCVSLVCSLKLWSLWEGRGVETVLGLLKEAIKEAGLVTYLHTYSRYYDALSRDSLADMFQLSRQQVQTLASRLIFNGELMAKWDQPTSTIVMQQLNPSRLQHLAENFADQVQTLADANGRALEIKTGVESFRDDRGGMYRHRGGDWGGRGGGGAGGGGGGGSGDRDRPPGGGRGGWRGGANGGPGGRGGYSGGGDRNRGGWSRGGRGGSMRGGIGRNVGSARREYRGIGI
jgi:translation initiation factor 3 subunit C